MKLSLSFSSDHYIIFSFVIEDISSSFVLDDTHISCSHEYLVAWLLAKSRPLFSVLPYSSPQININKSLYHKWKDGVDVFLDIFNKTNNFLSQCSPPGASDGSYSRENILAFKVDNQRYNNFFAYLSEQSSSNITELHEPTHWDGVKRIFLDKPSTYKVADIVEIITANRINKIITVNLDPLVKYMWSEHLNVFAILDYFCVSIFRIQNDPSELSPIGYLIREIADYDLNEFLVHPVLSSEFDLSASSNIFPSPILQDYSHSVDYVQSSAPINRVVVMSNSRYADTISNLSLFKPVLDSFDNPLVELPLWYLSISKLLDEDKILTSAQKHFRRSSLHWCFYYAAQYMKYQIINSVCPSVPLSVFGDDGWSNICPDRYSGYLDASQLSQVFEDPETLVLLVNFGYSYLEHSGPVYDVIRAQCNWLNVPSLVTTPDLDGLRNLEYNSIADLNHKITHYHDYAFSASDSRSKLASIYQSSTDHFLASVQSSVVVDSSPYIFHESFDAHSLLLKPKVSSYISRHIDTLLNQIYSSL